MAFLSEGTVVFDSGKCGRKNKDGVASYRIPALLKTKKGTLIAGADQRYEHQWDWGNIDMVVRRSENNGKTWEPIITVIDFPENPAADDPNTGAAFGIDMCLIQDPETERIFALYGAYPEGRGLFGLMDSGETVAQYREINGEKYLVVLNKNDDEFFVDETGQVLNENLKSTEYQINLQPAQAPYREIGDLSKNGEVIGNVLFNTNTDAPFRTPLRNYIFISHSDDEGKTWSAPRNITDQVRLPWMQFYGVGPGTGIALHAGEHKGRLVVPMYSTNHPTELNESQSARVIYSDDHGKTWQAGEAVNDGRVLEDGEIIYSDTMKNTKAQNTEACPVQLNSGALKLFMRNLSGHVQVATSYDGGQTWDSHVDEYETVNDVYVQMSAVQTVQGGEEYIVLTNADGPERKNGHVRVAKVNADDSLEWISSELIQKGKFAYNALKQIDKDKFGVIFEHASGFQNEYQLVYKVFDFSYALGE